MMAVSYGNTQRNGIFINWLVLSTPRAYRYTYEYLHSGDRKHAYGKSRTHARTHSLLASQLLCNFWTQQRVISVLLNQLDGCTNFSLSHKTREAGRGWEKNDAIYKMKLARNGRLWVGSGLQRNMNSLLCCSDGFDIFAESI
jgi:hypothetical protein